MFGYRNNVLWFASVETFNRIEVQGNNVPGGSVWLVVEDGSYIHVADLDGNGVAQWDWTADAAGYADAQGLTFTNGDYGAGRFRGFVNFPLDPDANVPAPPPPGDLVGAPSASGRDFPVFRRRVLFY